MEVTLKLTDPVVTVAGVLLQSAAPADSPGLWHAGLMRHSSAILCQEAYGNLPT